jgi:hypothetical protein
MVYNLPLRVGRDVRAKKEAYDEKLDGIFIHD